MTPKNLTAFRLDTEIIDGLKLVKERTGAPLAEQVRRAIVAWLEQNGIDEKGRPRTPTRKRTVKRAKKATRPKRRRA